MYKEELALNNLQWLICHKTQPNHIYLIYMYKEELALNNQQWLICHKTQPNQIIYIQYILSMKYIFKCNSYFRQVSINRITLCPQVNNTYIFVVTE